MLPRNPVSHSKKVTMRNKVFLFLLFAPLLGAAPVPCTTATLDIYEGLAGTGCTIDNFVYKNFVFQTLSATGGAIPIASSAVTVTPTSGGGNLNIQFTSSGFNISGTQFVQYGLNYTVDPLPPV